MFSEKKFSTGWVKYVTIYEKFGLKLQWHWPFSKYKEKCKAFWKNFKGRDLPVQVTISFQGSLIFMNIPLTHYRLRDVAVILEVWFSNALYWMDAWTLTVRLQTGIFLDNFISTMAADDPCPWITRSSAAKVLILQDKWALVFHGERFHPLVSSHCWYMIENDESTNSPITTITMIS